MSTDFDPSQTHEPKRHRQLALPVIGLLLAGVVAAVALPNLGWAHFMAKAGLSDGVDAGALGKAVPFNDPTFTALVEATHDEGLLPAATGDKAVELNAALPFSTAPILVARPFFARAGDMTAQQRALTCMTQAVYYEAGFEPEQGKRAVAQVVLNRMRHPAFPKSVCGVVYEGSNARVCQFSFTCDGSLFRTPNPSAWSASEAVARAALAGYIEPSVGMATHYHANYVSPYWAPRLTKMVQIGAHIFYRWPGGWGMPGAFSGQYAGNEFIPAPRAIEPAQPALAIAGQPLPAEDATLELAKKTLPANLVPERRAANDVGGRIDISKGWKLSIPDPSQTRGAMASITTQQVAETKPANAADGVVGSQL